MMTSLFPTTLRTALLGVALLTLPSWLPLSAQDSPFGELPDDAPAQATAAEAAPAEPAPDAATTSADTADAPSAAAESAEDTAATPDAASGSQLTLLRMLQQGGWAMWPLGACSVAFLAFTLYNLAFIRESRLAPAPLAKAVAEYLRYFNFDAARRACASSRSPLATILTGGLDRVNEADLDLDEIREGMEDAAPEAITKTQTTINYLSVIGVIAPMLGLLGTVSGMIGAFQNMALQGMGRPELFAGNISEALITTGAGLVVGIPAMLCYYIFKYRFNGIMAAASRHSGNVLSALRAAIKEFTRTGQLPMPPEAPSESGMAEDGYTTDDALNPSQG